MCFFLVFVLTEYCPQPWQTVNNRSYKVVYSENTWVDALATCQELGGILMTLDHGSIAEANRK